MITTLLLLLSEVSTLPDLVWTPNVAVDPVRAIRFGGKEVVLESTTLEQVRKQAGGGRIFHSGDAGDSLAWICYTVAHEHYIELLSFSSDEMGGGMVIDGFDSQRLAAIPPGERDCTPLRAKDFPASLSNGLWLGTPEARILHAYGAPRIEGTRWTYAYLGKDGEYDVASELSFKIQDGEVVGISMSHVTSN